MHCFGLAVSADTLHKEEVYCVEACVFEIANQLAARQGAAAVKGPKSSNTLLQLAQVAGRQNRQGPPRTGCAALQHSQQLFTTAVLQH
jgi:hypothetical protein